jgi:hypothetical protein
LFAGFGHGGGVGDIDLKSFSFETLRDDIVSNSNTGFGFGNAKYGVTMSSETFGDSFTDTTTGTSD